MMRMAVWRRILQVDSRALEEALFHSTVESDKQEKEKQKHEKKTLNEDKMKRMQGDDWKRVNERYEWKLGA